MKRVPFDSQVPSEALRIELKLFSQIHSRIQQLLHVMWAAVCVVCSLVAYKTSRLTAADHCAPELEIQTSPATK